jgi:NAD(P)-dependent dehydrogenase (short-subunit alcohol dehydrogenase family)
MSDLNGKNILITGGTTGIGLASARRLAAEGARVFVTGRNPETLAAARAELGDRATVIASDAGDPDAIAALFTDLRKHVDRLDVLFLNAGIARFAPLAEASLEDFDQMWKTNVRGPWLALKHALPLLADGASVIVNTSVVDQKGILGASAYAATKAGLRSIVRVAAHELAGRRIRVNAVSPGPIETPIYGKLGMPAEAVADFAAGVQSQIPLRRFGTPDEIAGAVRFFASSDSSFVTGVELAVDGGMAQV